MTENNVIFIFSQESETDSHFIRIIRKVHIFHDSIERFYEKHIIG